MPDFSVTTLDLAVFLIYLLGTRIAFGWYSARQTSKSGGDAESYFLSGRNISWPIIGLSFYVSNMSGSSFVAFAGSGYNNGIGVYNYEWIPAVILIFFIVFLLPLYLKEEMFTAPEFLQRRYGTRLRLTFSSFLVLTGIFIDAAASLYAGGTIVQTLYPSIPLWVTIFSAAAIAGIYITFGGLGAVVLNDALQAALIIGGGTTIAVLSFLKLDSWQSVRDRVSPEALHLVKPASDGNLPWPGLITGVLIIAFYYWCTNQYIIQRALGADSLAAGRKGALFAGLLKLPNLFILIMPGVIATVLYPDLQNPDKVFPTLTFDLLPVGLRGLILSAVAAAILSSLEAILNSVSTLVTMDFVRTLRSDTDSQSLTRIGRIATLVAMVLAALWAPQVTRFPTLWQYLQSIFSYVTPPVVAVYLFGLFWRRATSEAAVTTLLVGFPLGVIAWVYVEVLGKFSIQYLYACGILFVLSCIAMTVISLFTPEPSPETEALVWKPRMWQQETEDLKQCPWYSNYRYLSIGLIVLIIVMVVWWW
ncbi:sodium:solute symporter [Myxosarcina sp. GI1]|uniref:sodium:solute symporter n=1 Tax=Myxosarcina sp. GI1 TaxID=1541065 RepID=UPI000565CA66|nr:sodium:solute symporter [Myxosarcina sp. GI1]